ncbi:ABC transporter ATP-binding protein [Haloplasma contractile]|uniref:Lipoprotein-releasing system ATP-binding protein n=1 Tax=Haloplasma contractile SSD-17B TaxID=1033810 RepID=F7PUC7_9MOLU|nr:ABC transporter ATP-binding protein [Haloplasma contractile]ERJ11685.1 lipoprotein-releasing system ATP-binding protein [Haloplasma contractile SSD-17B]
MLSIKNGSLIYDLKKDTKTYALKNINLTLEEQKFYGILGPSGSGKSSLLYALSSLKKLTKGDVSYKKEQLSKLGDEKLASIRKTDFGFIFQKHFLISYLTILENVLVPVNSTSKYYKNRAKELLSELGLEHQMNKKPYQLSGGQCQRVAIARALINEPNVIFADEITASLDHKSAENAMKVLQKYRNGATLIVVTHDPSILKGADEIIHIWDGEIKDIEMTLQASKHFSERGQHQS